MAIYKASDPLEEAMEALRKLARPGQTWQAALRELADQIELTRDAQEQARQRRALRGQLQQRSAKAGAPLTGEEADLVVALADQLARDLADQDAERLRVMQAALCKLRFCCRHMQHAGLFPAPVERESMRRLLADLDHTLDGWGEAEPARRQCPAR